MDAKPADPEGRPSWDRYFMDICKQVATRSTCLRRHVGALIVKNKRILATGYNGAPAGLEHCATRGCLRDELKIPSGERQEICRAIHAEQNAIIQVALSSTSAEGATMYCTHQPCILCAKMIINARIQRVVYGHHYPDKFAEELFQEAGIEVVVLNDNGPEPQQA